MFRTIFSRNTADAGGLAVSLLTSAIAILDVQLLAAMVLYDSSRYYRAAMLDMIGGAASLGSSFVGLLILSAGFALNLFVIMFLFEMQARKGVSRIDRVLYRLIMPSGFMCTLVLAARAAYLAVYHPV